MLPARPSGFGGSVIRRGFGLLEAIVTIVILGLVFTTIPMLLSQANKSDEVTLEGEALYHAAALIRRIASMPLNSTALDGNESQVIDFDGSQCDDRDDNTSARSGTDALLQQGIGENRFRSCTTDTLNYEGFSNPANRRAINHFQDYERVFAERGFRLEVALGWLDDTAGDWSGWSTQGAESNLLLITVTARHLGSGEPIGTLRYVAANIGSLEAPIQQAGP